MKNIGKIVLAIGLASLVGCSSANTSALPLSLNTNAPSISKPVASSVKTGAMFVFTIASVSSVKTLSLSPKYIPANSGSIGVTVNYATNATTGTPGSNAAFAGVEASACPASGSSRTCTISMPLGPDSYNVNIVDYVGPSQTGAVISQVLGVPFTVTVNTVNSVSATLAAVIASLGVVPNTFSDNHSRLNSSNVLEVAGTAPASETVVALDAVGNVLPLALQPTCTNVAVSSSNSTVLTVGTPSNQNFTLSTQSLSSLPVTLTLGATCNGTNYTGSPLAVPVEELLVVAGNAIDGYGSFSSGLGYLDTMTIPGTNVGGLIRVNAVSQVVYVLDSVSGTFYSVTAGGAPIKLFTSPNAVGSADFAISPDGSSLYFSNRNNNVVFRIPFAFGVVTDAYSVSQPIQVDFDAAGNLYVAQVNFSGTVSKLPAGGTAFQSYVGGLYYPASLRVGNAANGGYLYVGLDNGSGQTYVYQGQTVVSNGTQASSYAFNAVGDVYMVNGYTNPATITVYPPGSTTARAGTKMTIAPGRASGEAEFII